MPNWCSTTIAFYSTEEKTLHKFFDEINRVFYSESNTENGFGKGWLGKFVNEYLSDIGVDGELRCRGDICEIDTEIKVLKEKYYFRIITETAWVSMIEMWVKILERHFPDINIAFVGEEFGNGYYEKHDDIGFFPEVAYCSICGNNGRFGDSDYFCDEKNAIKWAEEILQTKFPQADSVYEIEKLYNDKQADEEQGISVFYIKCKEIALSEVL